MKEALIIFVRKPEPGKVKTRLAATVGNEKALSIYLLLLEHTRQTALASAADKYVFYDGDIATNDSWATGDFTKRLQHGDNLGARMEAAFEALFEAGYQKLVIIGSDCFQLTTAHINEAFKALGTTDAVIGPAADGGYYLLGIKSRFPSIFRNKPWSTDGVLSATIADFEKEKKSYTLLEVLTDIDTEDDWLKAGPPGL